MGADQLGVNPLTWHSATNDYQIPLGSEIDYQHPTYGWMRLVFVKFLDAVPYANGHLCVLADATGLFYVTNDISGGTAIGTAGDAAASQIAMGVCIHTTSVTANIPAQNDFGYIMKRGTHPVKSDDGISQCHRLVADAVDGGVDTMADGEEEQVIGVALADDNDTTDRVLARIWCR